MPGFEAGAQVRVKDEIADLLVDRGFAKFENKVETATAEQVKKNDESVHVKHQGGKKAAK